MSLLDMNKDAVLEKASKPGPRRADALRKRAEDAIELAVASTYATFEAAAMAAADKGEMRVSLNLPESDEAILRITKLLRRQDFVVKRDPAMRYLCTVEW